MPAYIIFNYEITDRSKVEELSKRSKISDANSKYRSKLIAATLVDPLEGEAFPHIVMYEFENVEIAKNWYYDCGSKDIAELRREITNGWVSIIPGHTTE